MSRTSYGRNIRRTALVELLNRNPFFTDEELGEHFQVSVPTVRNDRLELGIPQLRDRVGKIAASSHDPVKSVQAAELVGNLVELRLNESAKSYLTAQETMAFEKNKIVKGQHIYSLAESVALAVIDANAALVGVANIKYVVPVKAGETMVADAVVKRVKGNTFTVWVTITVRARQVFRGKFILVGVYDG